MSSVNAILLFWMRFHIGRKKLALLDRRHRKLQQQGFWLGLANTVSVFLVNTPMKIHNNKVSGNSKICE